MPEERDKKLAAGEIRSPLLTWVENFWYHYKWQFLLSVFGIVVLIVCLVQCSGNGRGDDACVMYAGNCTLSVEGKRGILATLDDFVDDRNGDGKVVVGMPFYSIYTNEEIEKFASSQQGYLKQMSVDNRNLFDQEIYSGEASLCFISPTLFEDLCEAGALIPVSEYECLPEGAVTDGYGGAAYGVRLSSLAIYGYPGFSELPEDTILCLRTETTMGAFLGGEAAKAMQKANRTLAWRLLAAPAYVPAE